MNWTEAKRVLCMVIIRGCVIVRWQASPVLADWRLWKDVRWKDWTISDPMRQLIPVLESQHPKQEVQGTMGSFTIFFRRPSTPQTIKRFHVFLIFDRRCGCSQAGIETSIGATSRETEEQDEHRILSRFKSSVSKIDY